MRNKLLSKPTVQQTQKFETTPNKPWSNVMTSSILFWKSYECKAYKDFRVFSVRWLVVFEFLVTGLKLHLRVR